jgi:hypothetical protein
VPPLLPAHYKPTGNTAAAITTGTMPAAAFESAICSVKQHQPRRVLAYEGLQCIGAQRQRALTARLPCTHKSTTDMHIHHLHGPLNLIGCCCRTQLDCCRCKTSMHAGLRLLRPAGHPRADQPHAVMQQNAGRQILFPADPEFCHRHCVIVLWSHFRTSHFRKLQLMLTDDEMTAQPHASSGATMQTLAGFNAFGDLHGVLHAVLHA